MSAAAVPAPGALVRSLTVGPITRLDLALYCGASGDHNPIHVDSDYAQSIGMADVVGHGMLAMAQLGRLVTMSVPQAGLRSFQARFVAPVAVGDVLTSTVEATERFSLDGEEHQRLALTTRDGNGVVKLWGEATVAIPAQAHPAGATDGTGSAMPGA